MPVTTDFTLPATPSALDLSEGSNGAFFIAFISGDNAQTKQPWCPDVRAALPHINAAFSADGAPVVAFASVGQIPEYVLLACYSNQAGMH